MLKLDLAIKQKISKTWSPRPGNAREYLVIPGNSAWTPVEWQKLSLLVDALALHVARGSCCLTFYSLASNRATPPLYASLAASACSSTPSKLNDSANVILFSGFWRLDQVPDKVATCVRIVPPYFVIPKQLSKKGLSKLKPAKTVPMLDWLHTRAWQQYTVPPNLTVAHSGTTHQYPGVRRTCTWQTDLRADLQVRQITKMWSNLPEIKL